MRANILSEPDETDALVSTLMSDPEAEGMIEGDELIVGNLTLVLASGTSGSATWANASDATLNWIAGLGELTPGWAAGFGQVDDAQRRLFGIPRSVDQLQASIDSWAGQSNIDLTTYQVEARFGAYGALPIIVGVYTNAPDSGFILIDGVNGNMDGPFASATTINASSLLLGHPTAYVPGTSIEIADPTTGVCTPVAKQWDDDSPGSPTNPMLVPNWPSPLLDPTPWNCFGYGYYNGSLQCVCDMDGTQSRSDGVIFRTRIRCNCGGTGCAGGGQPGIGPVGPMPTPPTPNPIPPIDPLAPGVPAGSCTSCEQQWLV